jgi:hypothetical protein
MPLILFFDGSISPGCSRQSSVFHSYFISQNVCNFFHMLHFENIDFNLQFPERNTNLRLLFFSGVNTLNSVRSKNPPLNEAGDHVAFSHLVEWISRLTLKHLAESIRALLAPILPRTGWVIGSCQSIAGSTMDAPRTVINVVPDAGVCTNVYAKGFLNLSVSRIKGSDPVLYLDVCGKRGAEWSLAYEG